MTSIEGDPLLIEDLPPIATGYEQQLGD